jgi:hypothetical protein
MSYYLLEQSVTDQPTPFRSFFHPKGMFQDAQTTSDGRRVKNGAESMMLV